MAVLIKNVSYLIRDAERVEEGKDVLLKENKIWKVGKFTPDWVKGLSSYEVIDASGKWLFLFHKCSYPLVPKFAKRLSR